MLDLLSRVEPARSQTTTPRLTLHTKTGCPHCDAAKAWLTERGIPFDVALHDDDAERQALYDRLGLVGSARTVPQAVLTADGEEYRIGGYAALVVSGVESLFAAEGRADG